MAGKRCRLSRGHDEESQRADHLLQRNLLGYHLLLTLLLHTTLVN